MERDANAAVMAYQPTTGLGSGMPIMATKEWPIYVFDYLLQALILIIMAIWHPVRLESCCPRLSTLSDDRNTRLTVIEQGLYLPASLKKFYFKPIALEPAAEKEGDGRQGSSGGDSSLAEPREPRV